MQGAAQAPNIAGLDVWVADVQRAQLAQTFLPPAELSVLGVLTCRMGAESGSPQTFNVVRRLLELREALWLAARLPQGVSIDVWCEQKNGA